MSISFSLLKKAILEDKLAHFLLIYGSSSIDRRQAVMEIAMMLNCKDENKPCRKCSACIKILSGNHPDIHVVEAVKTSIGIEQILALQSKIFRKIYEGKYRVCLIEDAEKLTLPAGNALLKIAEEPPDNTIIILSTANPDGIITTLQSRAQLIYYSPANTISDYDDTDLFTLSGWDTELAHKNTETGIEKVNSWLNTYHNAINSQDFLLLFNLFPLEKEEAVLFLQVLTEWTKNRVIQGLESPLILNELTYTMEALRRQANYRLALEVLALKHIKLGGIKIG